jgi:hypothetical protein
LLDISDICFWFSGTIKNKLKINDTKKKKKRTT